MGLLDRFFGTVKDREAPAGSATTQFRESESETDSEDSRASRNAPRRELVQVVLRDTMRKHGIPSDWVECRMLSSITRTGHHGLHVNFVVKKAHDRLLAYVFAFQDSFERELARFEPRARDWLLSIGWEFQGVNMADIPDPQSWSPSRPAPLQPHAPLVQPDWLAPPASGFGPSADAAAEAARVEEEEVDVQRDLQALFAIRDAAMQQPAAAPARDHADFQHTQPSDDDDDDADADTGKGSGRGKA